MARRKQSKKSKVTMPLDGSSKGKLQAFRPDKDVAAQLEGSQNKSEVINEALRAHFGRWSTCPTCNGTGVVSKRGSK